MNTNTINIALAPFIKGDTLIQQVAFYVPDMDRAKQAYRALGCKTWTDDIVTAQGKVHDGTFDDNGQIKWPKTIINVAHLAFNYELGTEIELIHYSAGANWHFAKGRIDADGQCSVPFASHMSYHVDDMPGEVLKFTRAGLRVIQDVRTVSHTNPYLVKNGRRYNYVVFDSRGILGFDVKLIKRLDP